MVYGVILTGLAAYAQSSDSDWAQLGVTLGAVGGQLLLLRYSRVQEAQSDNRGVEYAYEDGSDGDGPAGLDLDGQNDLGPSLEGRSGRRLAVRIDEQYDMGHR